MMFICVNDVVNMVYTYDVYIYNIVESSNCVHDMSLELKLNISVLYLRNYMLNQWYRMIICDNRYLSNVVTICRLISATCG